jgi:hypothetical protein
MKIPFYFDDVGDYYKFNGIDKKYNKICYDDNTFIVACLESISDNILKVDNSYDQFYFYPIYLSWQCFHYPDKFVFNIPKKVIDDVKFKKCKILIINTVEGYSLTQFEELIRIKILEPFNLNYDNFIIISGNLIKSTKNGIKNLYYNTWEDIVKWYDENFSNNVINFLNRINSNTVKTHKFICLQRRSKLQ